MIYARQIAKSKNRRSRNHVLVLLQLLCIFVDGKENEMLSSYVVVDLEMTGLRAKIDRILEIGAVKVENNCIVADFHKLVNPKMDIPKKIIELTGITNEMAQKGCDSGKAVEGFLEFSRDLPLIGHNLIFDYSFIKQYAINHEIGLEKEGVDTLKLARKFLPELEKKTLDYLCNHLQIQRKQNHRALEDAEATNRLFQYLKEKFELQEPSAFYPKPLQYKAKKQGPASTRQKKYLKELADYHKIELKMDIDSLTKNEASRITDHILGKYGKIPK